MLYISDCLLPWWPWTCYVCCLLCLLQQEGGGGEKRSRNASPNARAEEDEDEETVWMRVIRGRCVAVCCNNLLLQAMCSSVAGHVF